MPALHSVLSPRPATSPATAMLQPIAKSDPERLYRSEKYPSPRRSVRRTGVQPSDVRPTAHQSLTEDPLCRHQIGEAQRRLNARGRFRRAEAAVYNQLDMFTRGVQSVLVSRGCTESRTAPPPTTSSLTLRPPRARPWGVTSAIAPGAFHRPRRDASRSTTCFEMVETARQESWRSQSGRSAGPIRRRPGCVRRVRSPGRSPRR